MTVVFTNGCFDILHYGHLKYLEEASKLGSKLIVGLNSDCSVRALKGEGRPLNQEFVRKYQLQCCKYVSEVIIFDSPTPMDLIKKIKPDVLVKGGDYELKDVVGGKFVLSYGGVVKSLNYLEGFSTTALIEKVKRCD